MSFCNSPFPLYLKSFIGRCIQLIPRSYQYDFLYEVDLQAVVCRHIEQARMDSIAITMGGLLFLSVIGLIAKGVAFKYRYNTMAEKSE